MNKDMTGTMSPELRQEFETLVARATRGDRSVLPRLREIMDGHPNVFMNYTNLSLKIQRLWGATFAGEDLALREIVHRDAEQLRASLLQGEVSPVMKLLIERVVVCRIEVNYFSGLAAQEAAKNSPSQLIDPLLKHEERAQRMYFEALKELEVARKLLPQQQKATAVNAGPRIITQAQAAAAQEVHSPEERDCAATTAPAAVLATTPKTATSEDPGTDATRQHATAQESGSPLKRIARKGQARDRRQATEAQEHASGQSQPVPAGRRIGAHRRPRPVTQATDAPTPSRRRARAAGTTTEETSSQEPPCSRTKAPAAGRVSSAKSVATEYLDADATRQRAAVERSDSPSERTSASRGAKDRRHVKEELGHAAGKNQSVPAERHADCRRKQRPASQSVDTPAPSGRRRSKPVAAKKSKDRAPRATETSVG